MFKKYLGITVISASMAIAGCSSNDDGGDDQETVNGGMTSAGGDNDNMGNMQVDPSDGGEGGNGAGTPALVEVPQEYSPGDDVTLSLVEELTNDGRFTILLQAVSDAGLADALATTGPTTVFAPTDDVLEGLTLPTDQAELSNLITGHVVSGALDGALIGSSVGSSVQTLNGTPIAITADPDSGALFASGVGIVSTDTLTTNGILHTINGVIGLDVNTGGSTDSGGDGGNGGGSTVPPGDTDLGPSLNNLNASGFTDYVSLHTAAQLGTSYDSNPWTAFIPTNDAIPDAALTEDQAEAFAILNNHIITTAVIAFEDLSALGETNVNSGMSVTFGGTPAAPTVNGFAITQINSPGTSALYQIDGVIQ